MNKKLTALESLIQTIQRLRDPKSGCPWDLKQTHDSLKQYLLEESYEVISAIEDNPDSLCAELGDLLLQVMLHAQIAEDDKKFSIAEIAETLNKKLVDRHPHIFGDKECKTAEDVTKSWEASKKKESDEGLLAGIPKQLPALHKANLIGERTERVGFDWDSCQAVQEKVLEEWKEYEEVSRSNNANQIKEELGDLLFSVAQLTRKHGYNAEELLQKANQKFSARFSKMEEILKQDPAGKELSELSMNEKEELWRKVKSLGTPTLVLRADGERSE